MKVYIWSTLMVVASAFTIKTETKAPTKLEMTTRRQMLEVIGAAVLVPQVAGAFSQQLDG